MKIRIIKNAEKLWKIRAGSRNLPDAQAAYNDVKDVAARAIGLVKTLNAQHKVKRVQIVPEKIGEPVTYYCDGVADKLNFEELAGVVQKCMTVNDRVEVVVKHELDDTKKQHRSHYRAIRRLSKGRKIRSKVGFCTASEDLKTFCFTYPADPKVKRTSLTFPTAAGAIEAMEAHAKL